MIFFLSHSLCSLVRQKFAICQKSRLSFSFFLFFNCHPFFLSLFSCSVFLSWSTFGTLPSLDLFFSLSSENVVLELTRNQSWKPTHTCWSSKKGAECPLVFNFSRRSRELKSAGHLMLAGTGRSKHVQKRLSASEGLGPIWQFKIGCKDRPRLVKVPEWRMALVPKVVGNSCFR